MPIMSRSACSRPAAPQPGPSPQSASPRPRRRALSAGGCLVALVLALTPALAGCGEATAQGTSPTEAATTQALIAVPDVVGMKGDAAAEALKTAGLTQAPSYTDVDGKESVWEPGNWSVTAQEPAAGAQVPATQAITLTVNHDSAKAAASARASASAAARASASASAAAAAEASASAAASAEAAASAAAAEEQARQEAARAAEEQAQQEAQQQEAQQQETQQQDQSESDQTQEQSGGGSSGVYYANCKEARAAGAAPLYLGESGYRAELDRDHDGIACEK